MMHAKIVLVDDRLGVLGSANVDMRSLFLNYEIALFFASPAENEALADWFRSLLPACTALSPVGRAGRLVESLVRLMAPLE